MAADIASWKAYFCIHPTGMIYTIRIPRLIRIFYPSALWRLTVEDKKLYLSFDDGPHPEITPFVLSLLEQYQAKASFFCIGDNVLRYPDVFRLIGEKGHVVGNHTQHHVNGWKKSDQVYLQDIAQASMHIDSTLFRPPYGKIKFSQARALQQRQPAMRLVMWDVLSGDFDRGIDAGRCVRNVISKARPGSIVVFHDSEKAFPRLEKALPQVLEYFSEKGYSFEGIPVFG